MSEVGIYMTPESEMAVERQCFEDAMYAHYERQKAAGKLKPDDGDGSREALFWKQPDGSYGVLMFNAAWYGWQAAKGLV